MAGGRSLEEKSLSKRQMFKQLREKLIEASQKPGFWDDGDTKAKVRFSIDHSVLSLMVCVSCRRWFCTCER